MNDLTIRDNLANLLERERNVRCLSIAQMAKLCSIEESQYKRIIYRETAKISALLLFNVCIALDVDAYEIYGIDTPNLSSIRAYYKRLSQRQRNFINALISLESRLNDKGDKHGYLPVLIPTGNMDDGMVIDSANVEDLELPIELCRYPNVTCGVKVTSNHLHPVYNTDDILLICCESPRHGDTGVFINRENGRAYIRKFYQGNPQCILEPINGHGMTIYVNGSDKTDMDKWVKFGYVVAKLRK